MVRYFPSDDRRSALATHIGFWPGSKEVSNRVFSAKLPVVCRQVHSKQPFGMFTGENAMHYAFSTFLLEAVLLIFFIKFLWFLLRPLRQPLIVCEIIGGMMIGPSMLGGSRYFNYYMFPPVANYICANLGLMGFFYFFFLTAAKTDVGAIWEAPRKHKYIAAIGVFVPMVCVGIVGMSMVTKMDKNMRKIPSLGGILFALAFTSFPVIYTILRDMNLLNSEVGKFAMSVALLGDMVAIGLYGVFAAMMQAQGGGTYALIWFLVSTLIITLFMLFAVKPSLNWIVSQTPEGKLVDQNYIVIILMGVLVSGFLTDMFGLSIGAGPIWLGLLIPHGPPLCSTLAVRSETFVLQLLTPFSYALVGLKTNANFISREYWPDELSPLFYMTTVCFITKFLSTVAAALFFKVPTRDSITLGLMMNLRGQIDLLLYLHWIDKRMIGLPGFTYMVLHTVVVTGISTPLISLLYDPTRPYRTTVHRTIQHTPQSTEMALVLAVSDNETLSGLITFLDLVYPTASSPFAVFAVHLMELTGRATPLFVDHEQQQMEEEEKEDEEEDEDEEPERVDHVLSALRQYQEKRDECVKLCAYTAYAPKRLMYQDICELALNKKTAFILLPYQKERTLEDDAPTELRESGMLNVNADVLAHTPCSVCIYYDKGRLKNDNSRIVLLFLGGADNREALHLADRMAANPYITLTVIRFLAHNQEGEDERERKLDDGVVTWFWVKNESNDRVSYKEVVVKNGAEALAAIQAMNVNDYDLWITGRREGINPKILQGLSTWSDDNQLGVIGETVAGSVFASEGSVLVVQQQVRNQMGGYGFLNGKFDYKRFVSPWSQN